MRHMVRHLLTFILSLTLLSGTIVADAAENEYVLNILYHTSNVTIDGATFQVALVASGENSSGAYRYTLVAPFENAGFDPNTLGVAEAGDDDTDAKRDRQIMELAKRLVPASVPAGALMATTGADGTGRVTMTQPGLYLVWQTGRTGTAADYDAATPMLVFVPYYDRDSATWQPVVTARPKTNHITRPDDGGGDDGGDGGDDTPKMPTVPKETPEPVEPTPEEHPLPESHEGDSALEDIGSMYDDGSMTDIGNMSDAGSMTGDDSPMVLWGIVAAAAAVVLIMDIRRRTLSKRGGTR